ncbi:glycosyltransferase family 4 protein [Phycicoccus duodecadis]|uniref:Glycosyltransferase involved in cell wall biosynthesis n=1 Tax=Phycicoccus duodecadis TaxID=173053 RepID=A0A2N3YJQ4_9MICO|nr:glycosyltransferase family 1 protein [Phycicoccus duodecadis]PKW27087.1 glycosyltransferase involved in cell wall biosynthesis [Phycicoccus duodecadis]
MTARTGLVWDARWEVVSGIGRFSREVRTRLAIPTLEAGGAAPVSPRGLLDLELAALRERRGGRAHPPRALVCPGFMAPLAWPAPTAVVVHDLMHRDVPGEAGRARRAYLDTVVRRSVRAAAVVLTVSDHSRDRILEWSGVAADRVVTVGNGVGPAFTPQGPRRAEDRPYLLYVGNHKPHKNLPRMLEAFARVPGRPLLLLSGDPAPAVDGPARALGVAGRLRFLGRPDDGALAAAYRGAAATLVLSTHEGFGLPALESMACATPVLASPVTSLPEVVGDAGLLADPLDVGSMTEGMTRLLTDDTLRARLATAGAARAAAFTWERVAARVADAVAAHLGAAPPGGWPDVPHP